MARAKRTNRAEARRRYRATLVEEPDSLETDDSIDATAEAADAEAAAPALARSRRRVASAAPSAAPPPRPGLASAFRASFRPLDVRADMRALPGLIRHRSVWLPVLITVGASVFYAAVTPPIPAGATNVDGSIQAVAASLLFQYFVFSPPVGSIFLAGFMAPRASYMTGAIAGLVGAICFAAIVLGRFGPFVQLTDAELNQYVASGFVASPLAGIFFGGAAGWYRRFLTLANPNRAARAAQAARQNDRQRRRGSEPRPVLARRR